MNQDQPDTKSEILNDTNQIFGWMRQRTSQELSLFVERRLAAVEEVVLD